MQCHWQPCFGFMECSTGIPRTMLMFTVPKVERMRDGSRFYVTRNRPNLKWISLKRAAHKPTHTHTVCMTVVDVEKNFHERCNRCISCVLTKRGLVLMHALICFGKFPFHWIGSKCLGVMLFKWISAECEIQCWILGQHNKEAKAQEKQSRGRERFSWPVWFIEENICCNRNSRQLKRE